MVTSTIQETAAAGASGKVSVIVATLNCGEKIRGCLDSIFRQSYQRREIIIVDGGSSDATLRILEGERGRIDRLIAERDRGIYQAFNKGVAASTGEWLCFLGCDDRFHDEDALGALVVAASGRASRIVYGLVNLIGRNGGVVETVGKPWHQARQAFLSGFMIPHCSALHHRTIFEQHGCFDESYRIVGDYEFLLRELIFRDALFVDRVVADMRLGGISSRAQTIYLALREVIRARRMHGLGRPGLRLRVALASSWLGARLHLLFGERSFNVLADCYRVVRGKPRVWSV